MTGKSESNLFLSIPETILQKYENIQFKQSEEQFILACAQNKTSKIPVILKILNCGEKSVIERKNEILIRLITNVMCESHSQIFHMRYEFCLDEGKCCFVFEDYSTITSGLIKNLCNRTISRREKHFAPDSADGAEIDQTDVFQGKSVDQFLEDTLKKMEKYQDEMNKRIDKHLQQKRQQFQDQDGSALDSAQMHQVFYREFDGTCRTIVRIQYLKTTPIVQSEAEQNLTNVKEKEDKIEKRCNKNDDGNEMEAKIDEDDLKLTETILEGHSIVSLEKYKVQHKSDFYQQFERESVLSSVSKREQDEILESAVIGTWKK